MFTQSNILFIWIDTMCKFALGWIVFLSHLEIVKDVTKEIFYNFFSELNNIFHLNGLKRFTFYVKLIDEFRVGKKTGFFEKTQTTLVFLV